MGAFAHLAAGVDRRGAIEEGYVEVAAGASRVGEEIASLVDAGGGDSCRRAERFDVGVLGKLDGAFHELGPEGSGRVSPLERS